MTSRSFAVALLLTPACLAACSSATEPEREVPGIIDFHEDGVVVSVPDTVRAGVPFEVAVRTYGGGCISEGGTKVEPQDGLVFDVRPFDVDRSRPGVACTMELRYFEHRAEVTVPSAGFATIRFHGLRHPEDSLVTVTRNVLVE